MDESTLRPKAHWVWLVFLLFVALIGYCFVRNVVATWDFTTDDAYITLRYSRNLVDGHGIVWNGGEAPPVEGYSNFSFVIAGAAGISIGLDPVDLLKWLGVLGLGLGCAASWYIARRFVGRVAALLPALFIVTYRGTAYWAVSGLETGFYLGLTLLCVALWLRGIGFATDGGRRAPSVRWLGAAYFVAMLVALTRPEGGLIAVVLTLASWQGSWRETLALMWRPLALFTVPVAAFLIWKLAHFGALMPNSAKCKALFTGDGNALTRDYWAIAAPWVMLSLAYPWRELGRRHVVFWLYPLAYAILLVGVDPIIGQWNRHALTPWSFLVIAGTIGLVRVTDLALGTLRCFGGAEVRAALVAVGATAWVAFTVADPTGSLEKEAAFYARRMAARAELGDWLESRLGPDDWVAVGDCGMVPYRIHAKVLDLFCLNSREISMPPVAFDAKRVAQLVVDRHPKAIVFHSREQNKRIPRHEYGIYGALALRPELEAGYRHATTIGAPGDDFQYWVYLAK